MASTKLAVGRQFTGTFGGDRAQAQAQAVSGRVNRMLGDVPFLRGRLVTDLVITGDTLITHALGYTMTGYFVVKSTSAGGELPAYVSEGPDSKLQVYLTVSVSGFSGDIWFF